jgi:hypothetical protein
MASTSIKSTYAAVVALGALQRRLRLTTAKAGGWKQTVRRERLASSVKSERRGQ